MNYIKHPESKVTLTLKFHGLCMLFLQTVGKLKHKRLVCPVIG